MYNGDQVMRDKSLKAARTVLQGHARLLLQRQHEQRQGEDERLAAAREGHADHVTPRKDRWQALRAGQAQMCLGCRIEHVIPPSCQSNV